MDFILAPFYVIPKGFPVSVFSVLHLLLTFILSLVSGPALADDNVSSLCYFCFSCLSLCSSSFVAKSCLTLFIASSGSFSVAYLWFLSPPFASLRLPLSPFLLTFHLSLCPCSALHSVYFGCFAPPLALSCVSSDSDSSLLPKTVDSSF